MKKYILVMLLFVASTVVSFAQDAVSQAFLTSYTLEASKQYNKAAEALNAVYAADSYEINFRMGWLYYANGDYLKAQSFYKKAMAVETNAIDAKLGYVMPTAALENWDEVLNTYKEILKIDPSHAIVNYRTSGIYLFRKDFKTALPYAQKLLSLYPFDYDGNVLIAKIYVGLGNITEAKKHYKRALHYSPQSVEVINALKNL